MPTLMPRAQALVMELVEGEERIARGAIPRPDGHQRW